MIDIRTLKNIKAVVFDLDGTVYYGNTLIDGVGDLTDFLEAKGIRVLYFTNNSAATRADIFEKLSGMGLSLHLGQVYNSAYAAAIYAKKNRLKDVFCIGSPGLIKELAAAGLNVVSGPEKARSLVVGLDKEFNYEKLSKALTALQRGCRFVVCNRDIHYPVEGKRLLPGCGPIAAAIECSYGVEADFVVGKPNSYMLELLSADHDLKRRDILVVGDTYSSYIAMAKHFHCPSVLITDKKMNDEKDVMVLRKITGIRKLFK